MKLKKQEQTESAERLTGQKLIEPKELTEALQKLTKEINRTRDRCNKANVVAVTTSRVVHS
jgi:hypothetical protein